MEPFWWDAMMWTDDPDYVPTDEDYLDSEPLQLIGLAGDFNGDSAIDAADYDIMLENFNSEVDRGTDGDITFNGFVDYRDFVSFREAIETQGAGVQSIPEPTSLFLFGSSIMLLGCLRRRRKLVCFAVVIAMTCFTTTDTYAQDVVIVQEEGSEYLAFEAEDYFLLNNADEASGWMAVSGRDPVPSFNPLDPSAMLLDSLTTNAFRGAAIIDFPGGNDQDFVQYRLKFVEDADYSLYARYSLFNRNSSVDYGSEDSVYVSSDFGFDGELIDSEADPRGPRDDTPSFYATFDGSVNNEGTYGWWNASANSSDNSAENPDAIYVPELDEELDFGIATREAGVSFDRIVFHANPNLSDEELDALISFDPFLDRSPNDFNGDGSVTSADVDLMRGSFGQAFELSESLDNGDGNRDGFVDYVIFFRSVKY